MIERLSVEYLHEDLKVYNRRKLVWLYYSYSKLEASPKTLEINI